LLIHILLNWLRQSKRIRPAVSSSGLRGNAAWEAAPAAGSAGRAATLPLAALERGYGMLSYIGRWTRQIEERVAQLSF